ncbi:MAG: metallophosphoesterase [Gemmatimonadales bacterium]
MSLFVLGAVLALVATPHSMPPGPDSVTFVVLGHIRGKDDGTLSPKLPELIDRVRAIRPAFVVLTGDIIWGDVHHDMVDSAWVEQQWDRVDSALAGLKVPVYRTPGNHDISDLVTRNIWRRRYGVPNQVLVRDGLRLVLIPSAWIPADGDTRHNPYVRPAALDSSMVRWLGEALAGPPPPGPTLVFMHHLLWWEAAAPWWHDVHPLLRAAGVQVVFGGDLGPLKFGHTERDGIRYIQSSMEAANQLVTLRKLEPSRILSSQFDNFLVVRVRGPDVRVEVEVLGALNSEQFTAERYRTMMEPWPKTFRERMAELVSTRRIAALAVVLLGVFTGGWWVGRRRTAS